MAYPPPDLSEGEPPWRPTLPDSPNPGLIIEDDVFRRGDVPFGAEFYGYKKATLYVQRNP